MRELQSRADVIVPPTARPEPANKKILLVDDSKSLHSLVRARLAEEPVDICSALDGESGLSLARAVQPDLVLLDVEMPGALDGLAVCRMLKEDPQTAASPVVLMSGPTSAEDRLRWLDLGAADYLSKPFAPAELRARVRAGLRTKSLMDLLARRAMIDGLTGLWNRDYFLQTTQSAFSFARRTGTAVACVLVDIDRFASVNARFGHALGDEVIQQIGQLLDRHCREEDLVCRHDGPGFAVLTPNTNAENAAALARRLRLFVENQPVHCRGIMIRPTCSFGVADASVAPFDANDMVAEAANALRRAKSAGRNRVVIAGVTEIEAPSAPPETPLSTES